MATLEPTQRVQINLPDNCAGVTDDRGRTYTADGHREVELPARTANALRDSGAVGRAGRVFSGVSFNPDGTINRED